MTNWTQQRQPWLECFHWVGMSELLGTEEEEPLVIPCTEGRNVPLVVGVSGPIAAGKTTMARALEGLGFRYTRYSLAIDGMLQEKGINPTRAARQTLGYEINQGGFQRRLSVRTLAPASDANAIVVDGLRFLQDRAWMVENFGGRFRHLHVEAQSALRHRRYQQLNDDDGFLEAIEAPVEREVEQLADLAHHVFRNDTSFSELEGYAAHLVNSEFKRW